MIKNKLRLVIVFLFTITFTMLPFDSVIAASTDDKQDIHHIEYASLLRSGWEYRGPGGRHDIEIGNHNETYYILAQFSAGTRVQYWDKNWNEVWAGNFASGITHTLSLTSQVYRITFYLDDSKTVVFNRTYQ